MKMKTTAAYAFAFLALIFSLSGFAGADETKGCSSPIDLNTDTEDLNQAKIDICGSPSTIAQVTLPKIDEQIRSLLGDTLRLGRLMETLSYQDPEMLQCSIRALKYQHAMNRLMSFRVQIVDRLTSCGS